MRKLRADRHILTTFEYDVLNHFPFATAEAKALADEASRATAQSEAE
jgi:hypothetical protein